MIENGVLIFSSSDLEKAAPDLGGASGSSGGGGGEAANR